MKSPGKSKIVNEEFELEEVDVEAYAGRGEAVPQAKRYRIRIDKKHYVVDRPDPSGTEILALADKTSENWLLYQIFRGHQPVPVDPNERVDLRAPGVERFTTVQKDPTEGLIERMRRDFALPSFDTEFLDSLKKKWETVKDESGMTVLILGWRIPSGYNHEEATLALRLPEGYPDTQIDMVYFSPALSRVDGKVIANLTETRLCGQPFQQWSRHRTSANPWRPGEDDISSHLSLVDDWLRREFRIR